MIHTTLFLFIVICTHTARTSEQKPQSPITLIVNTYQDSRTTGPNVEVQQHTDTLQETVHQTPKIHTDVPTQYSFDFIDQPFAMLYHHKWSIAASFLLSLYVYYYCVIQQTIKTIHNSQAWCCWKESCSCAQLIVQPKHELMQQLLFDIYKHYFQSQTLNQDSACFHNFVQDIYREKKILEQYLHLKTWLKKIHCAKFFPCTVTTTVIREKQARLEFIYDLFLHWHIEQKNCRKHDE